MKLSPDELKVMAAWRRENAARWREDIKKCREIANAGDTSQHDAKDFRAQAKEMSLLAESHCDYDKHSHKFGYVRTRCICDSQWTHPNCRICR